MYRSFPKDHINRCTVNGHMLPNHSWDFPQLSSLGHTSFSRNEEHSLKRQRNPRMWRPSTVITWKALRCRFCQNQWERQNRHACLGEVVTLTRWELAGQSRKADALTQPEVPRGQPDHQEGKPDVDKHKDNLKSVRMNWNPCLLLTNSNLWEPWVSREGSWWPALTAAGGAEGRRTPGRSVTMASTLLWRLWGKKKIYVLLRVCLSNIMENCFLWQMLAWNFRGKGILGNVVPALLSQRSWQDPHNTAS